MTLREEVIKNSGLEEGFIKDTIKNIQDKKKAKRMERYEDTEFFRKDCEKIRRQIRFIDDLISSPGVSDAKIERAFIERDRLVKKLEKWGERYNKLKQRENDVLNGRDIKQ